MVKPPRFRAALAKRGAGWGIFRRLERLASYDQYRKLIELLKIKKGDLTQCPDIRLQLDIPRNARLKDYKDKLFEKLVNRQNLRSMVGWDGYPLEDVQKATDVLINKYHVDRDQLAIVGGSYGGYLGARMLGWKDRTHNYKAAVLHAGVYDALSFFATDAFWAQHHNFGARPWRRSGGKYSVNKQFDDGGPEPWREFSRISPLLRSHKLVKDIGKDRGPAVLVTHGLSDLRVPWQQSLLYHRMLIDYRGKSRLALYPGLGHRLDQPEPSVQWWTDTLGWLAENGVEPGPK